MSDSVDHIAIQIANGAAENRHDNNYNDGDQHENQRIFDQSLSRAPGLQEHQIGVMSHPPAKSFGHPFLLLALNPYNAT